MFGCGSASPHLTLCAPCCGAWLGEALQRCTSYAYICSRLYISRCLGWQSGLPKGSMAAAWCQDNAQYPCIVLISAGCKDLKTACARAQKGPSGLPLLDFLPSHIYHVILSSWVCAYMSPGMLGSPRLNMLPLLQSHCLLLPADLEHLQSVPVSAELRWHMCAHAVMLSACVAWKVVTCSVACISHFTCACDFM